MYIIKRHEDDKYVAKSGSAHSYTSRLQSARTWATREAAERERCSNESITTVAAEMGS